jgi:N-acetylmuramoyl-L-alanine amidase
MKIRSICIDPGHGGVDNGAAYGNVHEDDVNLEIGHLLRCLLLRRGCEVVMTRETDMYVSLENRCVLANTYGVDLFLSVHCDAWHKETTSGISTHIFRGANHITWGIGKNVHQSLTGRFPTHANRGLKLSGFCVLRNTRMPAVLVECEFLSNPEMREFLSNPENQFALANAITNGILTANGHE